MSEKRKFNCSIGALLLEADAVTSAALKYARVLTSRLPQGLIESTRNLINKVSSGQASQKTVATTVGEMTKEQNAKVKVLDELLAQVRDTAKKAFKGHDVKLHEQFRVGGQKGHDLGAKLQDARIILASCSQTDNTDALKGKGWLPSDTERLAAAITQLNTADNVQETAKRSKVDATGGFTRDANELYDAVLTIQNLANIQWPASASSNAGVRGEFRLGTFPGKAGASAAKEKVNTSKAKSTPQSHAPQPAKPSSPQASA